MKSRQGLKTARIDTPLGQMVAIADDKGLYLLEFEDRRELNQEIERLKRNTSFSVTPGMTQPIEQIKAELAHYFSGQLQEFKTPLFLMGTPFQKKVWKELQKIPLGQTRAYKEVAGQIERSSAVRAVATANGANQLAIVVPCHRVITSNGTMGGYSGGIKRKEWLLQHEKR